MIMAEPLLYRGGDHVIFIRSFIILLNFYRIISGGIRFREISGQGTTYFKSYFGERRFGSVSVL